MPIYNNYIVTTTTDNLKMPIYYCKFDLTYLFFYRFMFLLFQLLLYLAINIQSYRNHNLAGYKRRCRVNRLTQHPVIRPQKQRDAHFASQNAIKKEAKRTSPRFPPHSYQLANISFSTASFSLNMKNIAFPLLLS
jgi:hypothetical protein